MEIIALLQSAEGPVADALALAITNLGSEHAYIALLVVGYLAWDARAARVVGFALLTSFLVNGLLKGSFDTARPFELDPDLLRSEAAGETAPGPGFPSGHAQLSATFWTLVAAIVKRRAVTVAASAIVVLVSLSRLYLGVHVPIDVLGGLLLGVGMAALALGMRARLSRPRASLGRGAPGAALATWCLAPLALLLAPVPDAPLIAGGIAGFGSAPHLITHRAPEGAVRRLVLALVGLVAAGAFLIATGAFVPDAALEGRVTGYLHTLLLAWVALVPAPLLAHRSGWAPPRP